MSKGNLFIISGASGVGKSTILAQVMAKRPDLQFSVSATTRPPRPGEIDGVHYFFITKERFDEMVRADEFLEYDTHMGNSYGTPTGQLEEKLKIGNVILDIEPVGAGNVLKRRKDVTLIFIAPPSIPELARRLRGRGDTPEEQVQMRLRRAQWEMEQTGWYDHVVINDQVNACADRILTIIAEHCGD